MSADGSPPAWPDALLFAAEPAPRRLALLARALRQPRRALPILSARLSGRRLRAAQAFVALVGAHPRLDRPRIVPPPSEPQAALAAAGIERIGTDAQGAIRITADGPPIVLLTSEGQHIAAGAAAAIAAAFADPDRHAIYGDALFSHAVHGSWLPLLRPAFDRDYLHTVDYLGPVIAFRRASVIGIDTVPGAAALDLALGIADRFGPGAVRHLPRLLSFGRFEERGRGERRGGRRSGVISIGWGRGARPSSSGKTA